MMNKQEILHNAIARINRGIEMAAKAMDEKAVEELTVTLEALDKQVPKKPVKCTTNKPVKIGNVTFSKGTSVYKCPNCGGLITYYKYCCSCGQALDWRNEDE